MGAFVSKSRRCWKPKHPRWLQRFLQKNNHSHLHFQTKADNSTQTSFDCYFNDNALNGESSAIQRDGDSNSALELGNKTKASLNQELEIVQYNRNLQQEDVTRSAVLQDPDRWESINICEQMSNDNEKTSSLTNLEDSDLLRETQTVKMDIIGTPERDSLQKKVLLGDVRNEFIELSATRIPLELTSNFSEPNEGKFQTSNGVNNLYYASGDNHRIDLTPHITNADVTVCPFYDVSCSSESQYYQKPNDDNTNGQQSFSTYNFSIPSKRRVEKKDLYFGSKYENSNTTKFSKVCDKTSDLKQRKYRCSRCQCEKIYPVKKKFKKSSLFYDKGHDTSPNQISDHNSKFSSNHDRNQHEKSCKSNIYDCYSKIQQKYGLQSTSRYHPHAKSPSSNLVMNTSTCNKKKASSGRNARYLPSMQNVSTLQLPSSSFPIIIHRFSDLDHIPELSDPTLVSRESPNEKRSSLPTRKTTNVSERFITSQRDNEHIFSDGIGRNTSEDQDFQESKNGNTKPTNFTYHKQSFRNKPEYIIIPAGEMCEKYKVDAESLAEEMKQTLQYIYQILLTEKTVLHKSTTTSGLLVNNQDTSVQIDSFLQESFQSPQEDKSTNTSEIFIPCTLDSILPMSQKKYITSRQNQLTESCEEFSISSDLKTKEMDFFNKRSSNLLPLITQNPNALKVAAVDESVLFDRNKTNDRKFIPEVIAVDESILFDRDKRDDEESALEVNAVHESMPFDRNKADDGEFAPEVVAVGESMKFDRSKTDDGEFAPEVVAVDESMKFDINKADNKEFAPEVVSVDESMLFDRNKTDDREFSLEVTAIDGSILYEQSKADGRETLRCDVFPSSSLLGNWTESSNESD